MWRALVLLAVVVVTGCGGDEPSPRPAADEFPLVHEDAQYDPFDREFSILPDTDAEQRRLAERSGDRADFRVPRSLVEGIDKSGQLAHAVIARALREIEPGDPRYRDLNDGQRALYALWWADAEIGNGGFLQFWENAGGVAPDVTAAARRIGAGNLASVFAASEALWPGGHIPRDAAARQAALHKVREDGLTQVDQRYYEAQAEPEHALGPLMGAYVRAHPGEFFAPS